MDHFLAMIDRLRQCVECGRTVTFGIAEGRDDGSIETYWGHAPRGSMSTLIGHLLLADGKMLAADADDGSETESGGD